MEKYIQILTNIIKSNRILVIILAVSILWHIIVALNDKTQVAGFFMKRPEAGYVWKNTENSDSKFFLSDSDVSWQAGIAHPDFKVESSEDKDIWNPMPGYEFIDKADGLESLWKHGLLHPDFKAWSDKEEGQWKPVTGYKFIYEGDTFVDSVWEPNKKIEDLKITSLPEQDQFKPFPGYRFADPSKSLKVVWSPGIVNYDNSRQIAGKQENTWEVNYSPQRYYRAGDPLNPVTRAIARRAWYGYYYW